MKMMKKTATKTSPTFLTMSKKQRKGSQTTAPRRTVTLQPPSASAHCCRSGVAAAKQLYSLLAGDNKKESAGSRRFSKLCVKNFFTVVLILIYLLLTAVAAFLAYQTISEVLEKLNNPVMSVTYQEVDSFPRPGLYGRHNLAGSVATPRRGDRKSSVGSNNIHCCPFSLLQESLCIPATPSCWDAVITTTMTSPRWWTQASLRKSTAW